jgi:hypothetical protein
MLQTMFAGQPLLEAHIGVDPFAHVVEHVVAAAAPPPPPPPMRQHRLPPAQLASVTHCWTVPPAHAPAFATQLCTVTWAPPSRTRSVQHSMGGAHEVAPHVMAAPPLLLLLLPLVVPGHAGVLHG